MIAFLLSSRPGIFKERVLQNFSLRICLKSSVLKQSSVWPFSNRALHFRGLVAFPINDQVEYHSGESAVVFTFEGKALSGMGFDLTIGAGRDPRFSLRFDDVVVNCHVRSLDHGNFYDERVAQPREKSQRAIFRKTCRAPVQTPSGFPVMLAVQRTIESRLLILESHLHKTHTARSQCSCNTEALPNQSSQ